MLDYQEDRENMRIEKEREDKRLADELARQLKEEEERLQFKTLQLKHSKNFSDSLPVIHILHLYILSKN